MTAVVISQPMLFPWPGFFEHLSLADVYIDLDDAQFSKGSFTNRTRLKWGDACRWMTVPLKGSGTFTPIVDLEAEGTRWRESHRDMLAQSLKHAPFRDDAIAILERAYKHDRVCDLLIASINEPAHYLAIAPRCRKRTTRLDVPGRSWQRVLSLVQRFEGSLYITGHGAARYLDHAAFDAAGIAVKYMRYSLTPWPQGGNRFSPYASILDLIAWTGPRARNYLVPQTQDWRSFLAAR
jgi:WbqC-like protein family